NRVFTGFSGDISGTTNPQGVPMSSPKSVAASFLRTDAAIPSIVVPAPLPLIQALPGDTVTVSATFADRSLGGPNDTGFLNAQVYIADGPYAGYPLNPRAH